MTESSCGQDVQPALGAKQHRLVEDHPGVGPGAAGFERPPPHRAGLHARGHRLGRQHVVEEAQHLAGELRGLQEAREIHRAVDEHGAGLGLVAEPLLHGRGQQAREPRPLPPPAALFRRLDGLHELVNPRLVTYAEVREQRSQVVLRNRDLAILDAHDLGK
nr:hypothetical protein [Dactylosporangium aurantiacum]